MRNFILRTCARVQLHQNREEGQTVIEYALVTAVVSIALIGLMATFGQGIIQDAITELDGYIT